MIDDRRLSLFDHQNVVELFRCYFLSEIKQTKKRIYSPRFGLTEANQMQKRKQTKIKCFLIVSHFWR